MSDPICPCCGLEVDGDRASFLTPRRKHCSRIACILLFDRRRRLDIDRENERMRKLQLLSRQKVSRRRA